MKPSTLVTLMELFGKSVSFRVVKPIFKKHSYMDVIGFKRTDDTITIPTNYFLGASIETFCSRQIASVTLEEGRRYFILWR